jgi:hypothetical protein
VGVLFRAKRNVQIAADAAAFAGALDYYYNGSDATAESRGALAAEANGMTSSQITVNSPPAGGPNATKEGFVEAIAIQPNSTLFMGYLSGITSINVAARAVAGAPGDSNNCVWLMDPTMDDALELKGNGTLDATNCGVYVNSNSNNAVDGNGNTAVNSPRLSIVGNVGNDPGLDPGHTYMGVPPQSPPIPTDISGTPTCTSTFSIGSITTANKATYSGSSTNNVVCFNNAVSIASGVSLPGAAGNGVLYVFKNGVSLGGTNSFGSATDVNGVFSNTLGATLDIAGGALSQGNAALSIYAPTSGDYNAIALMQPSTNPTGSHCPASPVDPCLLIQRGDSGSVFDGIIYAPGMYVAQKVCLSKLLTSTLLATAHRTPSRRRSKWLHWWSRRRQGWRTELDSIAASPGKPWWNLR